MENAAGLAGDQESLQARARVLDPGQDGQLPITVRWLAHQLGDEVAELARAHAHLAGAEALDLARGQVVVTSR